MPVLREVLGARATFADPADLAGLVAAAERLERPAPAALPRSWADVGADTWAVYEHAAG